MRKKENMRRQVSAANRQLIREVTAVTLMALLTLSLGACTKEAPIRNATDQLTFEEEVEQFFSEEALDTSEEAPGAIAVGSDGCEISDELRDQFDELIPITDQEAVESEALHAPFGMPVAFADYPELILHHNEYVLVYNVDLKVPTFATYRLNGDDIVSGDRKDCFREDHRLNEEDRSTLTDYDEPLFDRGHLVPVGDMLRKFSTGVNTFYLSNMMPQSAPLNRGVWKFLEGATRKWATLKGTVYILAGPIYDGDGDGVRDDESASKRIEFERRVGQPTHFFKILLHEREDGFIESLSFVLPHTFESVGRSVEYLKTKFATIDEIEEFSGYDFLAGLPDSQEEALEAFKPGSLWPRK